MIIGYDGSYAILKNNTTEGNYSKIVVESVAECYPRHRIYVYTPRVERRSAATTLAVMPNVNIKQPRKTLNKALWLNWEGMVKELERHHVALYHGLSGRLPLRIKSSHARSVVTIHGLGHILYPGDYNWWNRVKRDFFTKRSCRLADCIVTTSQHTKNDLIEHLGIDSDKIEVVYPAVDDRFVGRVIDAELDTVRSKYKLPKRYILVISSLLEHKNVMAVLQAMSQMQEKKIDLVLVGSETDYYVRVLRNYAQSHRLMHRLVHISRAHAADMASIYRMADVLVAPSRYEGFGLTVIEAQACDVPVITTSGTALEEAGGDAALYFEPDDIATLASHLDQVLADESLRERLIEAGHRNIERFTSQKLADNLDELYHKILRRK